MTNCPNCSAPLMAGHIKCEYCGTTFIDFTAIDLKDHKPCFLRVKTDQGIITVKVYPSNATFEVNTGYTDIVTNRGTTIMKIARDQSLHMNMEFEGVYFKPPQMNSEVLYMLSQEEE